MTTEAELQAEVDALRARLAELQAKLRWVQEGGRLPGSRVDVLLARIEALPAAFELSAVREVVPAARLAPLPEVPPWVLGTLNLRGATIPVIHVGSRLLDREPVLQVADRIVIAATDLGVAGLVVSDVMEVETVALDPTPSLVEVPHAPYVVGTFTHRGRARLLLGVGELLVHPELGRLLGASEGPPGASDDASGMEG